MLGFTARLLSQLLIAGCCLLVNLLLAGMAVLLRRLPDLLEFARSSLRWSLVVSFRLYRALLSPLAAIGERWLGVDMLSPLPRICASLALSLAWGTGLLLLLGVRWHLWSLWPFGLHGLLVGWLWDELAEPGGIRLGERL